MEPLDFTYLFNDTPENPAFRTMGSGIPIRAADVQPRPPQYKRDRAEPTEVDISSESRLVEALGASR